MEEFDYAKFKAMELSHKLYDLRELLKGLKIEECKDILGQCLKDLDKAVYDGEG